MTGVQGAKVLQIQPVATCGPGDKAGLLLLFHFHVLYQSQTEEQKNGGGLGMRLGSTGTHK